MAEPLTPEEEEQLKELRRRKAKVLRDQKRVRKYSPRKLKTSGTKSFPYEPLDSSVQKVQEEKQ